MKRGDLVKSIKFNSIGVIIEVFSDLDPKNPWVRVLFTHPKETYQWCRVNGLELVKKKNDD
jgi:hypothetical protein